MITTFETSPMPNQSMTSGSITICGTAYVRKIGPLTISSSPGETPAESPTIVPPSAPTAKPGSDRERLAAMCGQSSPLASAAANARTISPGPISQSNYFFWGLRNGPQTPQLFEGGYAPLGLPRRSDAPRRSRGAPRESSLIAMIVEARRYNAP